MSYIEIDDDDDDDSDEEISTSYSICSKNDLLAAITALLGGMAAQELIFKKTYDNMGYSLDKVNDLFLKMSSNGMLGLELFYKRFDDFPYSSSVIERLGEAIIKAKIECYEKAKEIVNKNEALIKKLVPILIKRKSIEKNECEELIEEFGGIKSN